MESCLRPFSSKKQTLFESQGNHEVKKRRNFLFKNEIDFHSTLFCVRDISRPSISQLQKCRPEITDLKLPTQLGPKHTLIGQI